ncbi:MAG: hypothetical protein QG671_309 [Actinomycetota bacterium]|nr:hypothetical protein [Actinomycetota bacterium]
MSGVALSFAAALKVLLFAGVIVAGIAGVIAIGFPTAALLSFPGIVLGAISALSFGRFWPSLAALGVLCALTWVALLVFSNAWAAAEIMALVGIALGLSCRIGLHGITLNIAIFTSAAFFAVLAPVGQVGTISAASSTAAAILVGGLMSITVFLLVARGKTLPKATIFPWPDTVVHTVSVSVTLFAATGIVLTWDRTPVSAWLLVTIVVLSQPIDQVTVRRSIQRVFGTLAGAVLAGVIIVTVTAEWLLIAIALVCLVFAWSYRLSHPAVEQGHKYWVYALIWTPAMVMLAVPQGGPATLEADLARVIFTIAAAIAVVAVTYLARQLVCHATPNSHDGSAEATP